jgi:hypothetical protein
MESDEKGSPLMSRNGMPHDGVRYVEAEIIPPDRSRRQAPRDEPPAWAAFGPAGARIEFRKPGLLPLIVAALTLGVTLAVLLTLFLGAFLLVLPAVGLIVAALAVTGIARNAFRRL